MMSGPLMLLRSSSRKFFLDTVSLPLKSHNTFTWFFLKGGAWADSELYQFGLGSGCSADPQVALGWRRFVYIYKQFYKHIVKCGVLPSGGLLAFWD